MDACIEAWVRPLLGAPEAPDPDLADLYSDLFPAYVSAREGLAPAWGALARARRGDDTTPRAGSGK
jgi:erythritol kinase